MTGKLNKIQIVDDDPHMREVVRFALEKSGFDTIQAADGRAALTQFDEQNPDLIILDISMPELDGTDVCRQVRQKSQVPIIFLSSRDEELDRILGLELGGDDYVTKPFSPRELVARVRAIGRRVEDVSQPGVSGGASIAQPAGSHPTPKDETDQLHGKLRLNSVTCEAHWGDKKIILSFLEFELLKALLSYPGKVYSRSELVGKAYRDQVAVSDRTIDSHIRRIRRKFKMVGGDPIETVVGFGYKLSTCEA